MFHTHSFDNKTMDTQSEEEYGICNAETSNSCIVKFTSPSERKICLRDNFMPARWLSKTIPRRNRSVLRYKINRSLNFDTGHCKNDYFTSHKASLHNSSVNNLHLSRSAKILKALNIDYNPMKNGGYKKINKTLNFDSTPSSKIFSNTLKSHCQMSNLRLSTSGVNKTLNFDSSEDSPTANSPQDTSIESIDENQNQTPSQRNSKVKKSLSYISLSSNGSNTSLDFNLLSPSLRTELREKIDDIVQTSMSPNLKLMRKSPGHEMINTDTIIVSTPRNLFNDFSDEDEERPETPKNVIRLIPESMSAIKKSHKKERASGRFAHRIQGYVPKTIEKGTTEDEEQQSLMPLTNETRYASNYNLRSVKKSYKKDQIRRESCGYRSEDELSETGSLFDYSIQENEMMNDKNSKCNGDEKIENSMTLTLTHVKESVGTNVDGTIMQTSSNSIYETENTVSTGGPTTPENRIDYLKRIMTDSIKKSHKKLKETNKKSLFKTRILEKQIDDLETNEFSSSENEILNDPLNDDYYVTTSSQNAVASSNDENRSSTPEYMNSSRLLLAQFSSVKKSHKKDKHRKIGFSQRHIIMTQEEKKNMSSLASSEDETPNQSSLLPHNIPLISITEASTSKSTSNSTFSSLSSDDKSEYCSLGTWPLEMNDNIGAKSISSPNKRKSPRSDENRNMEASSSLRDDSRLEYESAEDEFKIFTPIKKRKPLIILSSPQSLNNNNSSEIYLENSLSSGRCDTPKIGVNILMPEREKTFIDSQDDNNKCSNQIPMSNLKNENGRLTPENNGRLEKISALSSIKRSHKKDKRVNVRKHSICTMKKSSGNILQSDLETNDYSENSNALFNNWRQSRLCELSSDSGEKTEFHEKESSPKPSTSNSNVIIESSSPIKTPPNGLEAKTYLRLIQTTSIKRSHKKMREKKKIESIILDPSSSEDDSIFDETEKSLNSSAIENLRSTEIDDNHGDFMPLDNSNEDGINNKKMDYSHSSLMYNGNNSNDGSIFGSDDEMKIPQKS